MRLPTTHSSSQRPTRAITGGVGASSSRRRPFAIVDGQIVSGNRSNGFPEIDRWSVVVFIAGAPREEQQLVDDRPHAPHVALYLPFERVVVHGVGPRVENGDRRAQFMRGVGGEAPLPGDAGVEAGQRFVHRLHERQNLDRHFAFGKTLIERIHVDAGCVSGRGVQRGQPAPYGSVTVLLKFQFVQSTETRMILAEHQEEQLASRLQRVLPVTAYGKAALMNFRRPGFLRFRRRT